MSIQDVIDYISQYKTWPLVTHNDGQPKKATNNLGQVSSIKPHGISVLWEGMNYYTWYWAVDQKDKRTKHMGQLSFKY